MSVFLHAAWTEREERDSNALIIIYDWKDENKRKTNENIFTPENLRTMCKTEHVLFNHENYDQHCQLDYNTAANNAASNGYREPHKSIQVLYDLVLFIICSVLDIQYRASYSGSALSERIYTPWGLKGLGGLVT